MVLRKRKGPDGKDVYAASLVDGYYEFKKDIAVRGVADLDPDEIEQQFKMQEDSRVGEWLNMHSKWVVER